MDNWKDYGYVPTTPYKEYKKHKPIRVEGLYYTDDDGKKHTPYSVWFSCDTRNWHQNPDLVHGRACTLYLGKHGTTLAPVYLPDGTQYRREDLCEVSAYYRDGVLCDFHRE